MLASVEIVGPAGVLAFTPVLHSPEGVHMAAAPQHASSHLPISPHSLKVTTWLFINTSGTELPSCHKDFVQEHDGQQEKMAYKTKCGILVFVKVNSVTSQTVVGQTHLNFYPLGIPASILTCGISIQSCLKHLKKYSIHRLLGNFLQEVNVLMVKKCI